MKLQLDGYFDTAGASPLSPALYSTRRHYRLARQKKSRGDMVQNDHHEKPVYLYLPDVADSERRRQQQNTDLAASEYKGATDPDSGAVLDEVPSIGMGPEHLTWH